MEIVHLKLKHRPFCFSVKGHVKMLRLALTVTSMTFFIIAQAPEPYIVITGFEVTVIFFFILLYILRLDRLMKWLFWPLLDIINSLVTTVFMVIISVLALIPETTTLTVLGGDLINSLISAVFLLIVASLAMQEKKRRPFFYIGGSLCLAAAILCFLDAILVTKKMRNKMKKALGVKVETPPPEPQPKPVLKHSSTPKATKQKPSVAKPGLMKPTPAP
ncbi:chemokine-like factor isoform X6 [Tupaia chinensis]|uniref:chemokine-like factor isoform X6 n=1 Tax=Tupaia chinensis TaxID=246437 RepID=UPI000FFB8140|nr:chemokine-like factor isoform X6 [Tupaia chinensis]